MKKRHATPVPRTEFGQQLVAEHQQRRRTLVNALTGVSIEGNTCRNRPGVVQVFGSWLSCPTRSRLLKGKDALSL